MMISFYTYYLEPRMKNDNYFSVDTNQIYEPVMYVYNRLVKLYKNISG